MQCSIKLNALTYKVKVRTLFENKKGYLTKKSNKPIKKLKKVTFGKIS